MAFEMLPRRATLNAGLPRRAASTKAAEEKVDVAKITNVEREPDETEGAARAAGGNAEEAATEEEAGLGACNAISSSTARGMRRRRGMAQSNKTTRTETQAVNMKMNTIKLRSAAVSHVYNCYKVHAEFVPPAASIICDFFRNSCVS